MNIGVNALATMPNGDLVAGGSFSTAGGAVANKVARWNGSSWLPLGSGLSSTVFDLDVLPNGDLIAGGIFQSAGGTTVNFLARWDGGTWSGFGSGTSNAVLAVAHLPNGGIVAAGGFLQAGGLPSPAIALNVTTCPASCVATGAGCASSGGANTYVGLTLPWAGSAYRTLGTGLPSVAFVAVVSGFSATSIPLAAVLPPSPGGCVLLASPDVVELTISNAGTVESQIALPNTLSLAGVVLHQQLVALEVDSSLSFVQNTSTNALIATIGVL